MLEQKTGLENRSMWTSRIFWTTIHKKNNSLFWKLSWKNHYQLTVYRHVAIYLLITPVWWDSALTMCYKDSTTYTQSFPMTNFV